MLRVTTFHFPPYIIESIDPSSNSTVYRGVEINIIDAIIKNLGYDYEIINPADGFLWGFDEAEASFGVKGDVRHGRADLAVADIYMGDYNRSYRHAYDTTYPYGFDNYCFLVKKFPPLSRWNALMRPFQTPVWITLIAAVFTSIAFTAVHNYCRGQRRAKILDDVQKLISILLQQSTRINPSSNAYSIFINCFAFMAIILGMTFSGDLVTSMTVIAERPAIKTLQDLAETFKGRIGSTSRTVGEKMKASPLAYLNVLGEMYEPYSSHTDEVFRKAGDGRLVMLESATFLEYQIRNRFTDSFSRRSQMHVLDECWLHANLVTIILPSNSPLTARFDAKLGALSEAGLIEKWKKDTMDGVTRLDGDTKARLNSEFKPLSVEDLQIPFILLLICCALSTLVFSLELCIQ